jgi:hypothetical protein
VAPRSCSPCSPGDDCGLSLGRERGTLSLVIDVATLQAWITDIGFETAVEEANTLRLQPRDAADGDLPPFFIQCTENWVVLSMLPMLEPGAFRPEALGRRLLLLNREMRVAKFAVDKNGGIVLCAELPTESLDPPELADAIERMIEYARKFQVDVGRRRSRVPPSS